MNTVLNATKREANRRSTLTKIRKDGEIPGNVYGHNIGSIPIIVDTKEFTKSLQQNGRNGVFELDLEGKRVNAVLSELQRCALKGNVKHVDFRAINMAEALEVDVPIVPIGDSVGVKEGGILMQPNREIKIKVKPSDIPESIEVDVSALAIGETITVGQIRETVAFEILTEDDTTLVNITPPVSEEKVEVDAESDTESAETQTEETSTSEE